MIRKTPKLGQLDQLAKYEPDFVADLKRESTSHWIFVARQGEKRMLVKKKTFELMGRALVLVMVQDISSELEDQEIDAYQKLIRVLTHEIMNSVTPVVSLTTAIRKMVEQDDSLRTDGLTTEELQDLYKSILSIEKRGIGLMAFVKAYRSYMQPIILEKSIVESKVLLDHVIQLCQPELQGIQITTRLEASSPLFIDEKLVVQVLINIIKNANEALVKTQNPRLELTTSLDPDHFIIALSDNGPGIPNDIRKDIFIPFFTTKSNGTGIGLSLSKQIIQAHKGAIDFSSDENGTRFELRLPIHS